MDRLPPDIELLMPGAKGKEALLRAQRTGGGWFFRIAALSVINMIIVHSETGSYYPVGLSFVDLADEFFHSPALFFPVLAYIVSAIIWGIYVLFGYFAKQGKIWAFIIGLVAYAMDAVFYAVLPDKPSWLFIGFHVFVAFCIWRGLQAARKLKRATTPPLA